MQTPQTLATKRPIPSFLLHLAGFAAGMFEKAPWLDRARRFSFLKLCFFLLCLAPAVWMLTATLTGAYAPQILTELIHKSGDFAVRLLMLSLLITPLRHITGRARIMAVRRMVGLAAAFYAFAHVAFYCASENFDLSKVSSEIVLRIYLTIGFFALCIFIALTMSSGDKAIKRLGAKAWNALHRLVYGAAILALVHFILQSRLNVTEALMLTDIFVFLMLLRLMVFLRLTLTATALCGLTAAMAAAAALSEATYYALARNIVFWRVLAANGSLAAMRPSFGIIVLGLGLIALRLAFFARPHRPYAPHKNG